MPAKFHLTPQGPKPCTARKQSCRYGPGGLNHYGNLQEAQAAYEEKQEASEGMFKKHSKEPTAGFTFPLDATTQEVVDKLIGAGIRPLLVGGCVRDRFLGKTSKDIDMELYGEDAQGNSLEFSQVQALFPRSEGWHADEAGVSFSVLKLRKGQEDFDLSLPRTEQSTGDGHREYEVAHDSRMTFEEASSRRDFTINSMAFDPQGQVLVDPHGGARDLQAGILRHVGPAFSDDPLRCLRAVNFAARFNLRLAPETRDLCRQLAPTYKTLARERVEEEFNKLFTKGTHCERGLQVLHEMEWTAQVPPFKAASLEELTAWGKQLNEAPVSLRRGVLAYAMTKAGHLDPTSLLDGSSSGRTQSKVFQELARGCGHNSRREVAEAHRMLRTRYPEVSHGELVQAVEAVGEDATLLRSLPETPVAPGVTGERLLALGYKPGPEMGRLIKKAQAHQDATGEASFEKLLQVATTS